jgi:SAM-dependent methyltransferase
MADLTDPAYLTRQYSTTDRLRIRIETHRRYGDGTGDIFDRLTMLLAERGGNPARVLDIGAGTGNWYEAVRRTLGAEPAYVGVDRSAGMVAALQTRTAADARAAVAMADATALPFGDSRFDWAGAHFMLYHVPDIGAAIREAWRVLVPGGWLVAATNGPRPYRELRAVTEEAARTVGMAIDLSGTTDRFHLDNGHVYFPAPPIVVRWPVRLTFDAAEPVLRYLASGPFPMFLEDACRDSDRWVKAVDLIAARIASRIARDGAFLVHSESGAFLLRKPA